MLLPPPEELCELLLACEELSELLLLPEVPSERLSDSLVTDSSGNITMSTLGALST